jgi:hypothetical protein
MIRNTLGLLSLDREFCLSSIGTFDCRRSSLLKRGLRGTYVAVEPFHLDRYCDEQVFRYNNRATKDNPLTDADRFALAVSQVGGRRLTYKVLTGKEADRPF